jgi:hypothetical protein
MRGDMLQQMRWGSNTLVGALWFSPCSLTNNLEQVVGFWLRSERNIPWLDAEELGNGRSKRPLDFSATTWVLLSSASRIAAEHQSPEMRKIGGSSPHDFTSACCKNSQVPTSKYSIPVWWQNIYTYVHYNFQPL